MLIHAERSLLLSIDLQEKLLSAMSDKEDILRHNVWLTDIAQLLSVPTLATLQYAKGLGPLVPELAQRIPAEKQSDKLYFSAVSDQQLERFAEFSRPQMIVTGVEAHVCVLQTALQLRALGKEVFIVAEAVGSRFASDRTLALQRLAQEGCRIVSREMVLFEWLRQAGTDVFKKISREFLR